jgi:predicted RNase H-like HicB family nuclease
MKEFVTLIRRAADGTYRVSFAAFPNVMAAGQTLDDARANAERALFVHLRGLVVSGQYSPP